MSLCGQLYGEIFMIRTSGNGKIEEVGGTYWMWLE